MVYFITDGEYVKIGYSEDVSKRLVQLQTGNVKVLSIVRVMDGGYGLENSAHQYFNSYRVHNEWYSISEDDIDKFSLSCVDIKELYDLRLKHFTIVDYQLLDYLQLNKVGVFTLIESEFPLFSKRSFYNSKRKLIKLGLLKIGQKSKTFYLNKRYFNN